MNVSCLLLESGLGFRISTQHSCHQPPVPLCAPVERDLYVNVSDTLRTRTSQMVAHYREYAIITSTLYEG